MTTRVNLCSHRSRQLYRVILRDGRTQVTERCQECGDNPRGSPWVSQSELRVPLESLPILTDHRPKQEPGAIQRSLFEGQQ